MTHAPPDRTQYNLAAPKTVAWRPGNDHTAELRPLKTCFNITEHEGRICCTCVVRGRFRFSYLVTERVHVLNPGLMNLSPLDLDCNPAK